MRCRPPASSRLLVLVALVAPLAAAPARAEAPSEEFRAGVAELVELTGATAMGDQLAANFSMIMVDGMRQSLPGLPDRAIEIVHEVTIDFLHELLSDEKRLVDAYSVIYAKHFTKAELDEVIAFYRTPTGRKTIQAMPSIFQEGIQLSHQWVLEAQPRLEAELMRRLEAEGFLPDEILSEEPESQP